jgi:hypothetical protein
MKKLLLILILLSGYRENMRAQTADEWLRQKETQTKYLLQQIAALQVYLGYVRDGYQIVGGGLNTIRQIKDGDFSLHRDFIASLSGVNPRIRNWAKVAEIVDRQVRLTRECKRLLGAYKADEQFTPPEKQYLHTLYTRFIRMAAEHGNELVEILTADKTQMKDDERIRRIDLLYSQLEQLDTAARAFGAEARVLSAQRSRETRNLEASRQLHQLH